MNHFDIEIICKPEAKRLFSNQLDQNMNDYKSINMFLYILCWCHFALHYKEQGYKERSK